MPFETLDDFRALLAAAPSPDEMSIQSAEARNAMLTKPPGALGRLEDLAIWYAGWRAVERPRVAAPQVAIFAGNHGVAARGVSAFPPEVTAQMVVNFEAGGAAINQICASVGARLSIHPLDLDRPTADFTEGPAMAPDELLLALRTGWEALDPDTDLLVAGEMGIGNTTSAAALALALYGGAAEDWTGAGTGVRGAARQAKLSVVRDGAARHAGKGDGLETLRRLGGREIAAMAGAIAAARAARVPVILDGFIACAAAACLAETASGALDHCVAGHLSEEAGHGALLEQLGMAPLLSLGLRLGEGSGGALAISVLRAALACHSGMARFDEAGVSEA